MGAGEAIGAVGLAQHLAAALIFSTAARDAARVVNAHDAIVGAVARDGVTEMIAPMGKGKREKAGQESESQHGR